MNKIESANQQAQTSLEERLIEQLPRRDHAAYALAAQIHHLNIAAQREIADFLERRDYNGAHFREDRWSEEILEACVTHAEQNRSADSIMLEETRKQLTDLLATELRPIILSLPPAQSLRRAVDVRGPQEGGISPQTVVDQVETIPLIDATVTLPRFMGKPAPRQCRVCGGRENHLRDSAMPYITFTFMHDQAHPICDGCVPF